MRESSLDAGRKRIAFRQEAEECLGRAHAYASDGKFGMALVNALAGIGNALLVLTLENN